MKYVLIVLFVFLAVLPARAEKIAIAVLDLDAKGEGLSQGVADALTEAVRYEFSQEESFILVAREKMFELAKEKAIQLSGCTDVTCAVQIGKALNVQKLVVGSVTKLGDKYAVFLRVVDVEREDVECSEKEDAGSEVSKLDSFIRELVIRAAGCVMIKTALEALPQRRKDPEAHINVGKALLKMREYKEAEAPFREAIKLEPDNYRAHFFLGLALGDQGKSEEAVKEFRRSIQLDPKQSATYFQLGLNLGDQGKFAEAEKEFRKAIKLNPANAEAHYLLGISLGNQKKHTEAEFELRDAIRLQPDFADANWNLAKTLDALGRRKEARLYYEQALKGITDPIIIEKIKSRLVEKD